MTENQEGKPADAVNGQQAAHVKTKIKNTPGHLGYLTEQQRTAFEVFKDDVEQRFGQVSESTWYSDLTLLRFLRARRFSVPKAMQQFSNTDDWRKQERVEEKYASTTAEELRVSRRHYPRFLGRRDVYGRPVFVYRPASLDAERQKEIFGMDEARRFDRVVLLTEMCVRFWLPMASTILAQEHPLQRSEDRGTRVVSEVTSIVDLDGATLGQLWKLRSHLGQASTLTSAHYPETLGTIAIVNVPGFFSTIWGWIQKWFDEGTRNKMFIVSGDELQAGRLLDLIAKEDLPKVYGGDLEWRYEDEPSLETAIVQAIGGHDAVPDGPGDWNEDDGSFVLYDAEERKRYEQAREPTKT